VNARALVAAVVDAVFLVVVVSWAESAEAHGAPTEPISRAALCATGAPTARLAACVAAGIAADWDNIRLPDVAGQDRLKVPDGKLCSAGIARFAGLDLPRADWPTTSLPAGGRFTFRYRATIPHKGTFRLYLTKAGFDPTRPMRWADIDATPFLTATDPPLANGDYAVSGRLPAGREGRALIYSVWQNSSTPDTYYSCSDVVLVGAGRAAASAPAAGTASIPATKSTSNSAATSATSAGKASLSASAAPSATAAPETNSASRSTPIGNRTPQAVVIVAVITILGMLAFTPRRRHTTRGRRRA
jgi:predicted carbohydrate-binding protein with CBM5 and CBM33 domain